MKTYVLAAACVAAAIAAPASAQPWAEPLALLHNGYVEVEGGATVQGRSKIDIAATGLGTSNQSAAQSDDFFGGALVGYKLAPPIALEAEGVYSRNHLPFSPTNAVFGTGGATRTYGGLGNLRFSYPYIPAYTMAVGSFSLPITVEPYVAGGIGYGEVRYTGANGAFGYDDNQKGFIWQTKAGLEIRTGSHVALDIGYRYLQSPDYTHPGSFDSPGYSALTRSHVQAVTGGLKFYF